jgi:hypothetical protein
VVEPRGMIDMRVRSFLPIFALAVAAAASQPARAETQSCGHRPLTTQTVARVNQLAWKMLHTLSPTAGDKSYVVSPASAWLMYALLLKG